jgi:PAS domain S-box-containing protein
VNKSIEKILGILPQLTRDPFFILHTDGAIAFANKPGYSLLSLSGIHGLITDQFESESKERFNELLDKVIKKKELIRTDHFEIGFTSGKKINTEIILNTFEQGNNLFVLCTIIQKNYNISLNNTGRIKSIENAEKDVIKNNEVLEIVKKIKALYPITYIGSEIIHKSVDKFDEIFWITDASGKLLIVNDEFAKNMGLKKLQIEGKNADDFLPGYLKNLNAVIGNFIKDSMNCVLVEGIYFQEIKALKNKQIVQIPLFDDAEKLCALIGFSQDSENLERMSEKEGDLENLFRIIDYFPKPVAFITSNGIFMHSSEDFCKIFRFKPDELRGLKFADVLPKSLAESIQRFVLSSDKLRILPVNKKFEIAKNDEPEYTVYITKLFNAEEQLEGISVLFEKIEYAENLQHLIKSRGRMFEFLIENNPEPIYIYDKENLQFLEANQAALDLYGYSKDEFLLMDLTDLYNPDDIQTLLSSSSSQEDERKFSKPFRHKRKDGSSVYVEISRTSFKFNERDAHFNIIRNVSERLALVKNNQLFKAAFDNSINLIFVTDPDGIISFVNNAVISTLGFKKNELENSSMASLAEDEDRLTINTSIFQSHLTEPVELNIGLKSSDGKIIETELSATPVLDFEGVIESFVIIGKIVASIKPEEVIKEVVKETVVAKPVKKISSETSQLETAFLSGVFHEILTPMNVILGFAQELTEGIENLSPDQKEAVEIINQNRGKLLSTMNAIIEFSEIQKNKFDWDISSLTITKVVEEISRDIFEITGSHDISFAYGKISSSLQFETDKQKFDCLVNNLVRLVCRLISQDKVYFSAYQVENDKFIIMISDNYSFTSEALTETLSKLFVDKKDPKELGIPKLGVQITQSLIELLNVEFVSAVDESGKHETGFLFPIKFSPGTEQTEDIIDEEVLDEIESVQEFPKAEEEEFLDEFETGKFPEQIEEPPLYDEEIKSDETQSYSAEEITPVLSDKQFEPEETGKPLDIEPEKEPDYESERTPKTPEILSPPRNTFDAINFVSDVDDSQPQSEPEDRFIADESTSITEDLNQPLINENEVGKDDFISEPDFQPLPPVKDEVPSTDDLSIQEESSFELEDGAEIPDITEFSAQQDASSAEEIEDIPGALESSVPPAVSSDEPFEEIKSINMQAFTFEEAAGSQFSVSDDKLHLDGLSCLYIEDQIDSQILFKVQMKGLKNIKYAVSFEDALPLLDTETFDFIVMDINLQGEYNGLDALKIIHKMPGFEGIPIIAVTAYVLPGDRAKFIATGFNDFISKPIFREKMVESLEKIFLQKA